MEIIMVRQCPPCAYPLSTWHHCTWPLNLTGLPHSYNYKQSNSLCGYEAIHFHCHSCCTRLEPNNSLPYTRHIRNASPSCKDKCWPVVHQTYPQQGGEVNPWFLASLQGEKNEGAGAAGHAQCSETCVSGHLRKASPCVQQSRGWVPTKVQIIHLLFLHCIHRPAIKTCGTFLLIMKIN